jgi:hypothetical protein
MKDKYKLKLKNAIPIFGALEYAKRVSSRDYNEKVPKNDEDTIGLNLGILGFYNAIVLVSTGVAVESLLEHILK